jgi:hypothetical protein
VCLDNRIVLSPSRCETIPLPEPLLLRGACAGAVDLRSYHPAPQSQALGAGYAPTEVRSTVRFLREILDLPEARRIGEQDA